MSPAGPINKAGVEQQPPPKKTNGRPAHPAPESATMRDGLAVLLLLTTLVGPCSPQKPNTDGNRRHDVYIAGFFPYGRGVENSETGRGVMPSVKLALDHVNEHSVILKNYRLHMWWNDTMVREGPKVGGSDPRGFVCSATRRWG